MKSNFNKVLRNGLLVFSFLVVTACVSEKNAHHYDVDLVRPNMGAITTPIVMELDDISMNKICDTVSFDIKVSTDRYANYRKQHPVSTGSKNNAVDYLSLDILQRYEKIALNRTLLKHKCDILVNLKYDLFVVSSDEPQLNVVVVGYPANYKKIRTATKEDVWMINFMGQGLYENYNIISLDTLKYKY